MMKYLVLLGRFLYSWIFISTIFTHFSSQSAQAATAAGVPMAALLVPLSAVIAFLGGISILLGYKAKVGAWLIVLFLIPVTLTMHSWWTVTDPMMRKMQEVSFHKNLAIVGAAFLIAYFGAGPCSLDSWLANRSKVPH
jgi:putative oxidoreductase